MPRLLQRLALALGFSLTILLYGCSDATQEETESAGVVAVTTSATATSTGTPVALQEDSPTVVVRRAVVIVAGRYFESLDLGQLYTEAWDGAATALREAGVAPVPPAPAYPSDPDAAARLHEQSFPTLEQIAAGRLTPDQLIDAAVGAVVTHRNDCHTRYVSATRAREAPPTPPTAPPVRIGFAWRRDADVRIIDVMPGSPAELAGMRTGLRLLAVNGTNTADVTDQAMASLIDRREGVPNHFTVADATGHTWDLTIAAGPLPVVGHRVLAGGIGLLRFDAFLPGKGLQAALIAAVEALEAQGVTAWVLDLRWNGGGAEVAMVDATMLFVEQGVVFSRMFRGERTFTYQAEEYPTKLTVQRPLAILIGPMSASAAEVVAGSLQAVGRARLVGEPTRGCIGQTQGTGIGLPNGSLLFVTSAGVGLGPDDRKLNGIGLTPDIAASTTVADLAAGRDPQLDAAVQLLRE